LNEKDISYIKKLIIGLNYEETSKVKIKTQISKGIKTKKNLYIEYGLNESLIKKK